MHAKIDNESRQQAVKACIYHFAVLILKHEGEILH
jgi:hypothetical protein